VVGVPGDDGFGADDGPSGAGQQKGDAGSSASGRADRQEGAAIAQYTYSEQPVWKPVWR
jgi:hypothetical protein